jgi:hypothetical protein
MQVLLSGEYISGKLSDPSFVLDTTKQLTRAYAQQMAAIAKLTKRVKELEEKTNPK